MNDLQVFNNTEFGSVRTITIDGKIMFVGKDVADILEYTNTAKAIRDHVDDEDKLTERTVLSGQNREVIFINESGLYSLIFSSRMPNAKKFKRWVTSEVIPSIRENGYYNIGDNKKDSYMIEDPAEREKVLELCGGIETDNVNHPSHYETGKYQCIDVMEETQGTEAVKDFCICNAFKYIYRHCHKNGLEDVKKAVWYLNKYIELSEEK